MERRAAVGMRFGFCCLATRYGSTLVREFLSVLIRIDRVFGRMEGVIAVYGNRIEFNYRGSRTMDSRSGRPDQFFGNSDAKSWITPSLAGPNFLRECLEGIFASDYCMALEDRKRSADSNDVGGGDAVVAEVDFGLAAMVGDVGGHREEDLNRPRRVLGPCAGCTSRGSLIGRPSHAHGPRVAQQRCL